MDAGATPNFPITPASSMTTLVRRFSCTTREPLTHCARSLSGVQISTCSTFGSAVAFTAAAASASSAGLVSRPQPVAERLDDVIGGDAHVGGAAIDHAEDGANHAAHGANFTTVLVASRRHRVEVPEQLIRAVDEVNVQSLIPYP